MMRVGWRCAQMFLKLFLYGSPKDPKKDGLSCGDFSF